MLLCCASGDAGQVWNLISADKRQKSHDPRKSEQVRFAGFAWPNSKARRVLTSRGGWSLVISSLTNELYQHVILALNFLFPYNQKLHSRRQHQRYQHSQRYRRQQCLTHNPHLGQPLLRALQLLHRVSPCSLLLPCLHSTLLVPVLTSPLVAFHTTILCFRKHLSLPLHLRQHLSLLLHLHQLHPTFLQSYATSYGRTKQSSLGMIHRHTASMLKGCPRVSVADAAIFQQ